jgi:protein gp37
MTKTAIPYLTHTWHPVTGCSPVGEGCRHCWSERESRGRLRKWYGGDHRVRTWPERLGEPCKGRGGRVIGVGFRGDLYHEDVPESYICQVLSVMASCPLDVFVLPTKRWARATDISRRLCWVATLDGMVRWGMPVYRLGVTENTWFPGDEFTNEVGLPENVILMYSAWDQPSSNAACQELLKATCDFRALSLEPLLGPVDVSRWLSEDGDELCPACGEITCDHGAVVWVIAGGESGYGAGHDCPDWYRSLRDQCAAAGVPFWFKQTHYSEFEGLNREPRLDGQQYHEVPEMLRGRL